MVFSDFKSDITNVLTNLAADRDTNLEQYQKQVLATYQALLDKVTTENTRIQKSYPGMSVAGQKSIYINVSTSTLSNINNWLFWIYIAFAVILCMIVIMKPYSIQFKLFIVPVIAMFPLYIYPAEQLIYQFTMYIYNVLLSVVYNNGYGNTKLEYHNVGFDNIKHY